MCKNIFRFILGDGLTLTEVNPIRDKAMEKELTKAPNQKFFRDNLTGKLTFLKEDFDLINDRPFGQQFTLQIDKLQDNGFYINKWFEGEFTKTDCDFDESNKQRKIEVTPKPLDRYKLLVDARNKEFDLIDLSPDPEILQVALQPMIQVYTAFSNVLTNILSGVQFEQPVLDSVFDSNTLTIDYKFTLSQTLIFVPGDDTLLTPDVSGEYDTDYLSDNNQFQFVTIGFEDTNFPLQTDDPDGLAESMFIIPASTLTDEDFLSIWEAPNGNTFEYIGTEIAGGLLNCGFRGLDADVAPSTGVLTHVSGAVNTNTQTYVSYDNTVVRQRWGIYHANPPIPLIQQYLFLAPMNAPLVFDVINKVKRPALFSPINGSIGNFKVFIESVYTRVLTTASNFNGSPTDDIPNEDIVSSHGRYTKIGLLSYPGFQLFDGNQLESDKYGRFIDTSTNYANQYFIKPVVAATGQQIPVNISEWTEASFWILYTPALEAIQNAGNVNYFLNFTYKLSSLIKVLIQKIDPSLTYEEDASHSEFFNTVNPIRGDIRTPIVAPKTSVISGNIDKPARKVKVRFGDIEDMLRNFYQCYWYITDKKEFKIEFIDYFDRGLTYTGQNINDDLTLLLEPKTGKPWSYADKKYKFEKSELPEQITHSWMDETSTPFDGVPINLLSDYVEKGNLDERTMSIFTSDIDFIHSQASSISSDGFVLFEAIQGANTFEVPFLSLLVDGDTFNLQNGYASMFYAALNYWLFDLPSIDVNLNYEDQQATTIRKTKLQNVETPSTGEPDPMKLEISSLGTGSIDKMSINLSTGLVKRDLRHVTE